MSYSFNDNYILKHRDLNQEKNNYLSNLYEEYSFEKVFSYIFRDYIQEEGKVEVDKYNGIMVYAKNNEEGKLEFKREMVFKDHKNLSKKLNSDFVIANGILYAGKKNKSKYARYMCAMIIDLDGVESMDNVKELLHLFELKQLTEGKINHVTKPTFLVNSGTGFHLYYVFEKPIPLYGDIPKKLQNLKNQMTRHLWIRGVTEKTSQSEVQYQPITQGFRVVGSNSKLGIDRKVRAFKLNDRFNSDYWNEWIERQAQAFRNKDLIPIDLKYTSKLSLEKAKEKYPEWYQKRIVQGEAKGHYIVKRALYDWYKRELIEKERSVEGRRYYRVMCLAIYAKKCGISKEELEQDALRLYERINSEEHNHIFELDDMYAALEMYNDNYYTFPRKSIAALTGYEIKANKRNYRKQEDHLKISRYIRDVNNQKWD